MSEGNGKVLTETETLEKLGKINEEFFDAATELYEAVKDVDSGGSFNNVNPGVSPRVQKAMDEIDEAKDKLFGFIEEIDVADPQVNFYCPHCGHLLSVQEGDTGKDGDPDKDPDPDFLSEDCPSCGWAWDLVGYPPEEPVGVATEDSGRGGESTPPTEGAPAIQEDQPPTAAGDTPPAAPEEI